MSLGFISLAVVFGLSALFLATVVGALYTFIWLKKQKDSYKMVALGIPLVCLTYWAFGTRSLFTFVVTVVAAIIADILAVYFVCGVRRPLKVVKWTGIYLVLQGLLSTLATVVIAMLVVLVYLISTRGLEFFLRNFNFFA